MAVSISTIKDIKLQPGECVNIGTQYSLSGRELIIQNKTTDECLYVSTVSSVQRDEGIQLSDDSYFECACRSTNLFLTNNGYSIIVASIGY